MPKPTFKERCPLILEALRSASDPQGFNEIHALIKKTGVTLSFSTLKKCLEYLVFTGQLDKVEIRGPGNPTRYSISNGSFLSKFTDEIQYIRWLYNRPEMLGERTSDQVDSIQCMYISDKIRFLLKKLIDELYIYSNTPKINEANERYMMILDTLLAPCLFEIRELVKPDMVMSEKTHEQLLDLFVNNLYKNMIEIRHNQHTDTRTTHNEPVKLPSPRPETLALIEEAKEASRCIPRNFDPKTFNEAKKKIEKHEESQNRG